MNEEELAIILLSVMIFAGVAVLWLAMQSRWRTREMEHRERLAMIERGLIPPPERNPAEFESRMRRLRGSESVASARARSAGVILIGFGMALIMLISFAAGTPSVGIGVGGAFAVLGIAFLFNSALISRQDDYPFHPPDANPVRPEPPAPPVQHEP